MNAHQLLIHYENAPRIIHMAEELKPSATSVSLIAARAILAKIDSIKFPCHDASVLLERDTAEIARLGKMYPQPVEEKIDLGKPRAKGFRERLKSRIPEIKKMLDDGESVCKIADRLNLSETTILRVARHLRGEKSDEKNAVAIIGTHKITGEVVEFPSMSQAENYGGFGGSKISLCLMGRASHHKGFVWRRA